MFYRFYMRGVLLPVTPSSIKYKIANKNKTFDLVNGSQINLINLPGLSDISFSFMVPHTKYPFAVYEDGFQPPSYYFGLLERLKTNREAFDFSILRSQDGEYNSSWYVTLEDYTISESAKDGNDFTVDVNLKQYNEIKTKLVNVNENGEAWVDNTTSVDSAQVADVNVSETTAIPINNSTAYTVKKGDTLWSIAKINYGDATKWKEIYQNNKDVIESAAKSAGKADSLGGSMIFPGTVLQL